MISEGVLVFNEYLEKNLQNKKCYNYLKNIVNEKNVKYLPNNFNYLFEEIFKMNFKLPYKLDCLCYFINQYLNYLKSIKIDESNNYTVFYIRKLIDKENKVKMLEIYDNRIEESLKKLNISNKFIGFITDAALRKYEYDFIYKLQKIKY